MGKHDGSNRFSQRTIQQYSAWATRGVWLCLILLILAISFGCDTTPAPTTPVAASPTSASADLGTVHSVPTGAPSDTPTAAPDPAAPSVVPTSSVPAEVPATPTPVRGTPAPVPTVGEAEATIIYSLIAHDLVTQSQATMPAAEAPPYIGINPLAGRGPMLNTDSATVQIPEDLIDDLADLDTTLSFATFADVVGPLDEGGRVQEDGIYLTLGEIQPQSDANQVAVHASFYRANDDATGYRYTMERQPDGSWAIKDRQEVWDH